MGYQGSCQVVAPFVSEPFDADDDGGGDSGDGGDGGGIPVCTIKSFPYLPQHCVAWARDTFEQMFHFSLKSFIRRQQLQSDKCSNNNIIDSMSTSSSLSSSSLSGSGNDDNDDGNRNGQVFDDRINLLLLETLLLDEGTAADVDVTTAQRSLSSPSSPPPSVTLGSIRSVTAVFWAMRVFDSLFVKDVQALQRQHR